MERISRRKILASGTGAALLGAFLGPRGVQAQADKPIASPWAFIVDVRIHDADMATINRGPAGPFIVTGNIFRNGVLGGDGSAPASAVPIGTFRAWGWTWDPSAPFGSSGATMSFDIGGRGEIVGAGLARQRSSIVGGSGEFRGVAGQADAVRLGELGYRVWFDLTVPVGANGPN